MQDSKLQDSYLRRTVNDIVIAEMLLLQATIESSSAISDGINELGKQITTSEGRNVLPAISGVLQRTAGEAIEPYRTRFKYLRDMLKQEP